MIMRAYQENTEIVDVLKQHTEGVIIWKEEQIIFASDQVKQMLHVPKGCEKLTETIAETQIFDTRFEDLQYGQQKNHRYKNQTLTLTKSFYDVGTQRFKVAEVRKMKRQPEPMPVPVKLVKNEQKMAEVLQMTKIEPQRKLTMELLEDVVSAIR